MTNRVSHQTEQEIESVLLSPMSEEEFRAARMNILYVCEGSHPDLSRENRTYPLYRLRHGQVDLFDVAPPKGSRRVDFIIVARLADGPMLHRFSPRPQSISLPMLECEAA